VNLSVVIPVYNESKSIRKIVDEVKATNLVSEIIIVDDYSDDGTRDVLKEIAKGPKIKVVYHDKNSGKGAAVRTGIKHITGDIMIIQDADLEYSPADYSALISPIVNGVADVVYGSRMTGGKPQRVHMFWHKIGNNFLTLLTNVLFNTTLSDMETGYKVFKREVIQGMRLKSNRFCIEPEITAKVFKNKRLRVYEVPISYYGRTYEEGKKITWRQGLSAIVALIWYRMCD